MAAEAKAQTELRDFKSLFSLDGKVVLVTGGSRGLGLHAASGYFPDPPSVTLMLILTPIAFYKLVARESTLLPAKSRHAIKPAQPSMPYPTNALALKPSQYLQIARR